MILETVTQKTGLLNTQTFATQSTILVRLYLNYILKQLKRVRILYSSLSCLPITVFNLVILHYQLKTGLGSQFFTGSGSWLFFQAAPAPGFFFPSGPGSGSWFFFRAAPAPRGQKYPAPAPWQNILFPAN